MLQITPHGSGCFQPMYQLGRRYRPDRGASHLLTRRKRSVEVERDHYDTLSKPDQFNSVDLPQPSRAATSTSTTARTTTSSSRFRRRCIKHSRLCSSPGVLQAVKRWKRGVWGVAGLPSSCKDGLFIPCLVALVWKRWQLLRMASFGRRIWMLLSPWPTPPKSVTLRPRARRRV